MSRNSDIGTNGGKAGNKAGDDGETSNDAAASDDRVVSDDGAAGEERAGLAAQQARLLEALVADGPEPVGFDTDRLRTQARMLVAKRRDVVSRNCPELMLELGERCTPLFERYCGDHPPKAGFSARKDAHRFQEWLVEQGLLNRRKSRFLRRLSDLFGKPTR